MFSSKGFESCSNRLVRYLFKTLPVATHSNFEPIVFLIEVYFRKVENWDYFVENKECSESLTPLL